jgi:hypothetical protein
MKLESLLLFSRKPKPFSSFARRIKGKYLIMEILQYINGSSLIVKLLFQASQNLRFMLVANYKMI